MQIEIRSPGCHVHMVNGVLEVRPGRSAGGPAATPFRIPPAEVTGVVVEAPQTTLTAAALVALATNGAHVVLCDDHHQPALELVRADGSGSALRVALLRAQVLLRASTRERLWRDVVRAKILLQALTLERQVQGDGAARLRQIAEAVRPDDHGNREAAAAQAYWPALMGKDFRRGASTDDPVNARLNYGYAVLRSVMLRGLNDASLHPGFGLHHSNRENPGSLADDLMEPYRPAVDALVHFMGDGREGEGLAPAVKRQLAEVPGYPVRLNGQSMRLANAVAETCQSLAAVLRRDRKALLLPEALGHPDECPKPGEPCG